MVQHSGLPLGSHKGREGTREEEGEGKKEEEEGGAPWEDYIPFKVILMPMNPSLD